MRKKFKYLLVLLLLVIPYNKVFGLSVSISCSSRGEVYVGDTFDVTIYGSASEEAYWQSDYVSSSGNIRSNSGSGSVFSDSPSSSLSKTYSFTATSEGTATVSQSFMVSDEQGNDSEYSSNTCYINVIQPSSPSQSNSSVGADITGVYYGDDDYTSDDPQVQVDESLSNNNYLKSITVNKGKLSPDFNKDKTEYSIMVDGDVDKINISAEIEEAKASMTGTGEKTLSEGLNRFEIEVVAENGEKRVYVINVTRKEKDPIEVTINKKKYTILKKEGSLRVPEGFKKTSITIDKQEVVAYKNDTTGYLIVALVDQNGKASWFKYNQSNSTYTKYNELNINGIKLILLEPNKEDIPYKYYEVTFEINKEEITGYALEYESPFRLVYGLNVKTGEKGFYLYDAKENTLQRFYNVQVEIYTDLVKKMEILGIALLGIILVFGVIIICQFALRKKIKKYVANPKKEEEAIDLNVDDGFDDLEEIEKAKKKKLSKEEKKQKELEKTAKQEFTKTVKLEMEKDYQEQELTKQELKQKKKAEKEELKKARKEFLD